MDAGDRMADLNVTQQEIYKDIRLFLLGLFPGSEKQVIQAAQNNNPLPYGAIVMQILFATNLDVAVVSDTEVIGPDHMGFEGTGFQPFGQAVFYASSGPNAVSIQNSVEVRMQLDFYGETAEPRSRIINNLWRTFYGCERLKTCQPLYVQSYNRHVYVNDSNQYEDRWILDVALQYNPQVTIGQDYTSIAPDINITPVTE